MICVFTDLIESPNRHSFHDYSTHSLTTASFTGVDKASGHTHTRKMCWAFALHKCVKSINMNDGNEYFAKIVCIALRASYGRRRRTADEHSINCEHKSEQYVQPAERQIRTAVLYLRLQWMREKFLLTFDTRYYISGDGMWRLEPEHCWHCINRRI